MDITLLEVLVLLAFAIFVARIFHEPEVKK